GQPRPVRGGMAHERRPHGDGPARGQPRLLGPPPRSAPRGDPVPQRHPTQSCSRPRLRPRRRGRHRHPDPARGRRAGRALGAREARGHGLGPRGGRDHQPRRRGAAALGSPRAPGAQPRRRPRGARARGHIRPRPPARRPDPADRPHPRPPLPRPDPPLPPRPVARGRPVAGRRGRWALAAARRAGAHGAGGPPGRRRPRGRARHRRRGELPRRRRARRRPEALDREDPPARVGRAPATAGRPVRRRATARAPPRLCRPDRRAPSGAGGPRVRGALRGSAAAHLSARADQGVEPDRPLRAPRGPRAVPLRAAVALRGQPPRGLHAVPDVVRAGGVRGRGSALVAAAELGGV
ncbi:MAG: hypothetical protein AVDCRST_MAG45-1980, partial [uncultured Solirubrobacterales bacterium]